MKSDQIVFYGLCIFLILVIVLLLSITWLVSEVNSNNGCQLNPSIWCYNDWKCNTPCSTPGVNTCYGPGNNGYDSLAECLFGVKSPQANFCTEEQCECVQPFDTATNCFKSCPGLKSAITCSTFEPKNN